MPKSEALLPNGSGIHRRSTVEVHTCVRVQVHPSSERNGVSNRNKQNAIGRSTKILLSSACQLEVLSASNGEVLLQV